MNIRLLAAALIVLLVSCGSAYLINFEAPLSVTVGEPIVITGTSNLPPGFSTEMVLHREIPNFQPKEIERKPFTIQEGGGWDVVFETAGLPAGAYKTTLIKNAQYPYGSSSDTFKVISLVNRSGEVAITSPQSQVYTGTLEISGIAAGRADRGITITVTGPSGVVFGPKIVKTDLSGRFSQEVSITSKGTYRVGFSDEKGLITETVITVIEAEATIIQTAESTAPASGTPAEKTPLPISIGIAAVAFAAWLRR